MSQLAVCPACDKRYRVPDHVAAARCKVCRAPLEFEESAAPEEEPDGGCPSCGAAVEPGAAFCAGCGEALSADAPPSSRGEKRLAAAQMSKAMGRVERLKLFLAFGLAMQCFALLVLVAFLLLSDEVSAIAFFVVAITVSMIGLLIYGLRTLERRPFLITLSLALLQTLNVALGFLSGAIPVFPLLLALYFWTATASAAQVERIAREHPDLFLARRMRGETRQGSAGRRQRQIERDRKAAARRKWVVLGAVGGVLALIGVGAKVVSMLPEEQVPTAVVEGFRDAWNQADVAGLGYFAGQDNRARLERGMGVVMKRYEWAERLPNIESFELGASEGLSQRVRYVTEAGAVPVGFRKEGDRWTWRSVDFRDVKHWRP
jgi:hypothetical protein